MERIFDLDSPELRASWDEAILWCADRQLSASPADNDEIRRRRNLMDEGHVLMQQAMRESESVLNRLRRRTYAEMAAYSQGTALLSEANPATFTSFTRRLRSAQLDPAESLTRAKDPAAIAVSVILRRTALLENRGRAYADAYRAKGRLLIFWPAETLSDGAAEYASCGYFDTENAPPWDTWIAFSRGALLSWVPADLVELVNHGIEVNPEQCIAWYDMSAQRSM